MLMPFSYNFCFERAQNILKFGLGCCSPLIWIELYIWHEVWAFIWLADRSILIIILLSTNHTVLGLMSHAQFWANIAQMKHVSMVNHGQQWSYHGWTIVDHGKLCCTQAFIIINHRSIKWHLIHPWLDLDWAWVTMVINHGQILLYNSTTMVEPCFLFFAFELSTCYWD